MALSALSEGTEEGEREREREIFVTFKLLYLCYAYNSTI